VRYSCQFLLIIFQQGADLTRIHLSRGLAIVAAALLAMGVASAQPSGGAATRGVDTSHVPPPRPRPQDANPTMSIQSAVQFRLELLEEDLRIRPEQQKAWVNYRDRVMQLAEDAKRSSRTALTGDMPAPQRLDRLADIARDRLTAIEDIVDAGKQLYAVLTPGQQGVADRRLAVPVMALAGVEPDSPATRAGAPAKSP
jgi:hypothetical protein